MSAPPPPPPSSGQVALALLSYCFSRLSCPDCGLRSSQNPLHLKSQTGGEGERRRSPGKMAEEVGGVEGGKAGLKADWSAIFSDVTSLTRWGGSVGSCRCITRSRDVGTSTARSSSSQTCTTDSSDSFIVDKKKLLSSQFLFISFCWCQKTEDGNTS